MPEILFAQKPTLPAELAGNDASSLEAFLHHNGLGEHELIQPGRAYSFAVEDSFTLTALRRLNALPVSERMCLARSAEAMGDEAHVLKVLFETNLSPDNLKEINGLVGAGATAAFARLNGFQQALVKYQEALLNFTKMHKAQGPGIGTRRIQAEKATQRAFQSLQNAYEVELNRISPAAYRHKNRGNALSNAERGVLLASRSSNIKPDARLFVADAADAGRLGSFCKFLNNTGRLAVVTDAALRANKVHTTYESGGNWLRESSIQMTGFGIGGATGGLIGKGVVAGGTILAAKAGLLVAGPIGWAVLGVIVVAGVATGYGVGTYLSERGEEVATGLWDR